MQGVSPVAWQLSRNGYRLGCSSEPHLHFHPSRLGSWRSGILLLLQAHPVALPGSEQLPNLLVALFPQPQVPSNGFPISIFFRVVYILCIISRSPISQFCLASAPFSHNTAFPRVTNNQRLQQGLASLQLSILPTPWLLSFSSKGHSVALDWTWSPHGSDWNARGMNVPGTTHK